MTKDLRRVGLFVAFAGLSVLFTACSDSKSFGPGKDPDGGVDAAPDLGSVGADVGTGGSSPEAGGSIDSGSVTVTLSESTFVFDTPDQKHTFTATVTGAAATTVSWSSSNSYIATVDATGAVTSVSGGQAVITATSTADTTKTAAATVAVS
jgi:hypothetical protein